MGTHLPRSPISAALGAWCVAAPTPRRAACERGQCDDEMEHPALRSLWYAHTNLWYAPVIDQHPTTNLWYAAHTNCSGKIYGLLVQYTEFVNITQYRSF